MRRSNGEPAVEALRALIRIPTVSDWDRDREDRAAFAALLDELRARFPRLHEACEVERISGDALLVRWAGRGREAPVVLMAHLDVVPVDDPSVWTHPPFAAELADGFVWGRGALDCKGSLVATCQAVEDLIAEGVMPGRDVWLSFGCNEEVSGRAAKDAVAILRERGVEPWFVIDEGGAIVQGVLPGVARRDGRHRGLREGHGRRRPHRSRRRRARVRPAAGRRDGPARAGHHPARAAALPGHLPDATVEMMERAGAHARMPFGVVFSHARLLRPVLAQVLPRLGHETAAMTRTTVAVTQLSGSPGANVIAATARAHVNMRVMVGETVDGAIERIRKTVGDPHVEVTLVSGDEPSPVSPTDDAAYRLLETTLADVFPGTVAVPYVMLAATDSRHFHRVWPRVYRFTPFRMTAGQRASIHGVDERIGVEALLDGVQWYRRLIEQL